MMRRRVLLSLAAILLTVSLGACGSIYPSTEAATSPNCGVQRDVGDVTIGFAGQTLAAPYHAAMQFEAEKVSQEMGFKLLFQSANGDPLVQMNQMQAMISQCAQVLVVNATSVNGQEKMMAQIASVVPVIYIDTAVPDTGATAVTSDNLTIGRLSGELTARRFLEMGKNEITMVVVGGFPTDEFVGPRRRQGFLDGLTAGGVKYTIVAEQPGYYVQDKAQIATENMLAANPNVDLVLGLNDAMGLGAYNVIARNPRYSNVLVAASADGQKEAVALIKKDGCEGRYVSTGLNSPSLATEDALRLAVDIATGQVDPADVPPETFTKAVGIDCRNAAEFYDPNSVF